MKYNMKILSHSQKNPNFQYIYNYAVFSLYKQKITESLLNKEEKFSSFSKICVLT
jgi:hypothetical protein